MAVTAFIGLALAFATGCQQKGAAEKGGQSVGDRASESMKIVQESAKRVQDSLKQAKKESDKKAE
jgi:hypothetical protein